MKKLLFTLSLLVASFAFVACDDDDDMVIELKDLPTNAQTFLETHFPAQEVTRVIQDNDGYDVYLNNGFEIDFTLTGEWDDVDGRGKEIPASILALIPESIPAYVTENYPDQIIVEINKEHFGYEVDLNNNVELEFDSNGTFLRIDK